MVELAARDLTKPRKSGSARFISRGTLKIHLLHICANLEVRNRSN